MARNGCKKIIIVNGHGGNNSLLPYFAQAQLEAPHDTSCTWRASRAAGRAKPKHKSDPATDMHAGETNVHEHDRPARPVHLDRAPQESGADQRA